MIWNIFLCGCEFSLSKDGLIFDDRRQYCLCLLGRARLIVPCWCLDSSRLFPASRHGGRFDCFGLGDRLGLLNRRGRSRHRHGCWWRSRGRRSGLLLFAGRFYEQRLLCGMMREAAYRAICAQDNFDVAGLLTTFAWAGAETVTATGAEADTGVVCDVPLVTAVSPPQVTGVLEVQAEAEDASPSASAASPLSVVVGAPSTG